MRALLGAGLLVCMLASQLAARCVTCLRDGRGRIRRSRAVVREFERETGHPGGWRGHVVDHIIPLARGGCDCRYNLEWQTVEEGRAKDRWEMACP